MANLLMEIEAEIAAARAATAKQNVGVIREIADGVARIEGLTEAMLNEMIDLGHGITGLALNLDQNEVGVVILGDYTELGEGDEVRATGMCGSRPKVSMSWYTNCTRSFCDIISGLVACNADASLHKMSKIVSVVGADIDDEGGFVESELIDHPIR